MTTKGLSSFYRIIISLVPFIPCSFSCILLLNGWTPLSVYERTALADVVISGFVLKTFKYDRTSAQTYRAEVKVLNVYKGIDIIKRISANNHESSNIYNISNFGDKKMCYADIDRKMSYIFFLTEYKSRLSAKYDDIFGAVVDFTEENENEIYQQLGWDSWSSWGSCSRSCGKGLQTRQRACQKQEEQCVGSELERRKCNFFSCKGVRNMLDIFGVLKDPHGVQRDVTRPTSYKITERANIYIPLTSIFRTGFPKDFSIITTVRLSNESDVYLFTLSDIMGKQRLAIKLGRTRTSFEYYDQNDLPGFKSPTFDVDLTDNEWHQFAFSIKGKTITFYSDCGDVISKPFSRSAFPSVGMNLMASLGPFFARYGEPFQGDIEQLAISTNPGAASQQCTGDTEKVQEQAIKDDGEVLPKHTPSPTSSTATGKVSEKEDVVTVAPQLTEWSSWSSCSTSCGKGTQSRSLYCVNNEISIEECVQGISKTIQTRLCHVRKCKDPCIEDCLNGGRCGADGRCVCPSGFQGNTCQNIICSDSCENGGVCSNGTCSCPNGYSGQRCQKAVCKPECRNGGTCVAPGVCSCPRGYLPPICTPHCAKVCHNGGKCIRKNKCSCRRGYTGSDCSTPLCRRGCYNGGKCVAPNRCSCVRGFTGKRCHKAVCNPACQNRGVCIYPHVCRCRRGYYGSYCQQYTCRKKCKNGGTCIGKNKCKCRPGFSGKWCNRGRCRKSCLNGGKCVRNKCRCPAGFGGKRCQRRGCKYEKYIKPYQKSFKRLQREEYTAKCGPFHWRTCTKTRFKYVTMFRMLYKTAYRCKSRTGDVKSRDL